MDVSIKEEPPLEIEGYVVVDATVEQTFVDFSDDDQASPRKKRKRPKKSEKVKPYKPNDEMQQLLQTWGLEILSERFSKNLIDLSVLDYIVDVDIVDLCQDLPLRYRLILRHKLAEKRGARVQNLDSNGQREKSNSLRSMSACEKSRGEPLLHHHDEHLPKRARCPIDMVLTRPFATRTEDEKRLLISMDIPRPAMSQLKSSFKKSDGSTVNRNFYRTSYETAWWMCGSQKRNKLYCWPCLLFSQSTDPANSVWGKRGFSDLNHLSASSKSHSLSQRHIDNVNAYKHYGQPPETKQDNEMQSGSTTENDVKNMNRIITANVKASSNDTKKHPNDTVNSPAPSVLVTIKQELIENILEQDAEFQLNTPSDRV